MTYNRTDKGTGSDLEGSAPWHPPLNRKFEKHWISVSWVLMRGQDPSPATMPVPFSQQFPFLDIDLCTRCLKQHLYVSLNKMLFTQKCMPSYTCYKIRGLTWPVCIFMNRNLGKHLFTLSKETCHEYIWSLWPRINVMHCYGWSHGRPLLRVKSWAASQKWQGSGKSALLINFSDCFTKARSEPEQNEDLNIISVWLLSVLSDVSRLQYHRNSVLSDLFLVCISQWPVYTKTRCCPMWKGIVWHSLYETSCPLRTVHCKAVGVVLVDSKLSGILLWWIEW